MSGIIGTSHSRSKIIGRAKDTVHSWCRFRTNSGTSIRRSFNISSLTDLGTGYTGVTLIRPHADGDYAIAHSQITQYDDNGDNINTTNQTATYYTMKYWENGTARDGEFRTASFGD